MHKELDKKAEKLESAKKKAAQLEKSKRGEKIDLYKNNHNTLNNNIYFYYYYYLELELKLILLKKIFQNCMPKYAFKKMNFSFFLIKQQGWKSIIGNQFNVQWRHNEICKTLIFENVNFETKQQVLCVLQAHNVFKNTVDENYKEAIEVIAPLASKKPAILAEKKLTNLHMAEGTDGYDDFEDDDEDGATAKVNQNHCFPFTIKLFD